MNSKKVTSSFIFFMLFVLIFSIFTRINTQGNSGTAKEDVNTDLYNLKQAGFWNNFTFIHITGSNWTIAKTKDWCSGTGTWSDPYLIEDMQINASNSPIGSGILIENSLNELKQE